MKRTPIRVEPFASYLERRRKGPVYPVIVAGETVYVSGLPPFEPGTGEIKRMPFEQQADIVLAQMKHCLEVAGSSLDRGFRCRGSRSLRSGCRLALHFGHDPPVARPWTLWPPPSGMLPSFLMSTWTRSPGAGCS